MVPGRMFALALALAGCGRIGFGAGGGAGGGGGDSRGGDGRGPDGVTTGPSGARYGVVLDSNAVNVLVAGRDGEVAVAESFVTATTIAGKALVGHAMYESYGLVWLDPTGVPGATSVLDSTSICELRGLGASPNGVVATGYSQSGTTDPMYGACSLATAHQDGVAIAVDKAGAQQLDMHAISTAINIQGWTATTFDDGTVGISGVYGSTGDIGTTSLPNTTSDENAFYTRVDPTTGEPTWLAGAVQAGSTYADGLDALGGDACAMGAFSGSIAMFGTAMTSAGLNDVWLARLDPSGTPRWLAQIGGTGDEAQNTGQVAATSDGGCTAAFYSTADLTVSGTPLPVAAGPSVVLHFDGTGAFTGGARTAGTYALAQVGGRAFGALTTGTGIAIVSLADVTAPVTLATASGPATLDTFAAVPPDAVAFTFAIAGPVTFGSDVLTPPVSSASAVGVVGVGD